MTMPNGGLRVKSIYRSEQDHEVAYLLPERTGSARLMPSFDWRTQFRLPLLKSKLVATEPCVSEVHAQARVRRINFVKWTSQSSSFL